MESHHLDELDRWVLSLLDRNCRSTSVELGERLQRSRQTIDYRIRRLEDNGIIRGYTCSFNPTRIGYRLYKIYLRLRSVKGEREKLRKFLFNLGSVYWLGESSGMWDLLIGIFYKDESEIVRITDQLAAEFRPVIVAHSGHMVVRILQYPKMYFTGELQPAIEMAGKIHTQVLTDLDSRILAALIGNARISFNELGDSLAVSSLLIQRRIKRLVETGVIIQSRISVDLEKIGLELYKAIIYTDLYGEEEHRAFIAFISTKPELQFFVRNIWSVELELIVPHYGAYEGILDEIRIRFPKLIAGIETLLLDSDEWTPAFANLAHIKSPNASGYNE